MRRSYAGLCLLPLILLGFSCEKLLGPRHSVLLRLDDPSWKTTGTGSISEDIAVARKVLPLRLSALGAIRVRSEAVAGDQRQLRLSYFGNIPPLKLRRMLGDAGRLEFRLVASDKTWPSREKALEDPDFMGVLPAGTLILPGLINDEHPAEAWYLLESDAPFTDADLRHASATSDASGRPAVGFSFNVEAGARFQKFTERNLRKKLAIVLNGKLVTAPVIESPIGANGIIHGAFTDEEVEAIVEMLNSGGMPLQPVILELK